MGGEGRRRREKISEKKVFSIDLRANADTLFTQMGCFQSIS